MIRSKYVHKYVPVETEERRQETWGREIDATRRKCSPLRVSLKCFLAVALCVSCWAIFVEFFADNQLKYALNSRHFILFYGSGQRFGNRMSQLLFWISYAQDQGKVFLSVPFQCFAIWIHGDFEAFWFCAWTLPWVVVPSGGTPTRRLDLADFSLQYPHENHVFEWLNYRVCSDIMKTALARYEPMREVYFANRSGAVLIHERCKEGDTLNIKDRKLTYNPTAFDQFRNIPNGTTKIYFVSQKFGEPCERIHQERVNYIRKTHQNAHFQKIGGKIMQDFALIYFAPVVFLPFSTFSLYPALTSSIAQKKIILNSNNPYGRSEMLREQYTSVEIIPDATTMPYGLKLEDGIHWLKTHRAAAIDNSSH